MRLVMLLVLCGACEIAPLDEYCQDVSPGDLVITEIQEDGEVDWVEVYASKDLSMTGMSLQWTQLTGKNQRVALVRSELDVTAGSYYVFGSIPIPQPAYLTYDFASDIPQSMWGAAAVDVVSCGQIIDRVIYRALPDDGSLVFPGDPDADANDNESAWCHSGDTVEVSSTPGVENPSCN